MKQIPYFLLFNYPKKMNAYIKAQKKNKELPEDKKVKLNAYHSCSPLNELCEYICRWEKQKLIWDKSMINTGVLLINGKVKLKDKEIMAKLKRLNNEFATEWRQWLFDKDNDDSVDLNIVLNKYRDKLLGMMKDRYLLANYFIKVCYDSVNTNKTLCWYVFGEEMIKNLRMNSPKEKSIKISEVPGYQEDSFEFLGKYYQVSEV